MDPNIQERAAAPPSKEAGRLNQPNQKKNKPQEIEKKEAPIQ